MTELGIAIRAIHLVAVLLLFGEILFFVGVARPALRAAANVTQEERRELHDRLIRVTGWSLALAIASGVLWLGMQAASMSGTPLERSLSRETLSTVLGKTLFGRVWEIRLVLAIALGATLFLSRRKTDNHDGLILGACGGVLAGGLLATLVWAGHAAAQRGADQYIHLLADSAHLLAAGAWLGALPALIFLLARARYAAGVEDLKVTVLATQRFSTLGIVSVGVLLVSGAANTWYLVGSVPALLGTPYGRLLLVKLMLFAMMVTLAAINRLRLTPQLAAALDNARGEPAPQALRWLWRNAITETALGLTIVAIVGALGVTIPALHVQPVWPFPYTLSWAEAEQSAELRLGARAAGIGALLASALIGFGARKRKRLMVIAGLSGLAGTLAVSVWLSTAPAYPTSYVRSPLRYAADSIARGATLYAQNCAVCHGPCGYGDGPAAASLGVKPANLTEKHFFHHREGDVFWWLQHGIPRTPMPGFGDRMSEVQLWDVINFLRAQAEAEDGKAMDDKVEPWRPIVAPDFTFQIDRRPQESLKQQRGRFIVLLVLYTLPESHARLRTLTESKRELDRAGVRIIAMPMNEAPGASQDANMPDIDASIMALPDSNVVATYNMFGRAASFERWLSAPAHVEFLIDRQGHLRARWMPASGQGWDQFPKLFGEIGILNQENPRPPAPERHVH